MLDRETAKKIAIEFINKQSKLVNREYVIDESLTMEKDDGWIFTPKTRRYLETNDHRYGMFMPRLVVNKFDGSLDYFTEKPIKRPKYCELDQFLSERINYPLSEEVLSYEGTIRYYITQAVPAHIQRVLEQGKALLSEEPFPVDRLSKLTKLAFEDEDKAKDFLKGIIQLLEFSEPYDLD